MHLEQLKFYYTFTKNDDLFLSQIFIHGEVPISTETVYFSSTFEKVVKKDHRQGRWFLQKTGAHVLVSYWSIATRPRLVDYGYPTYIWAIELIKETDIKRNFGLMLYTV